MNDLDKNMNKIINLYSFTCILTENYDRQSPDYIKEKYDHFIGFDPVSDYKLSESDNSILDKYNWSNKEVVSRQILYLKNNNLLLDNMVYLFEKYIGPISLINDERKYGLHKNLETMLYACVETNSKLLKTVLRDLRIESIL